MMHGIIACSIFVVFFILTQSKIKRRKKQIKELKAKIKKLECDKKHLEVRLQDAEELAVFCCNNINGQPDVCPF